MRTTHIIKRIVLAALLATMVAPAAPASFCSLANNTLKPEGYREVGEVITINFAIDNTGENPCPAEDKDGRPNMRVNMALAKLVPDMNGGEPHVEGPILDYFNVVYNEDRNELNLIQKADVPHNSRSMGHFYVKITAPSIEESDAPNIGYIANLSSLEANTYATNDVNNFTLTRTHPSLQLEKTVDTEYAHNPIEAGDLLLYKFKVTNTGDSKVDDIQIIDIRIDKNVSVGSLDVNESGTAEIFYEVKASDIIDGNITNQATASGVDVQERNATSISDDPTTPEPNDPTVVDLSQPPVAQDDNKTGTVGEDVTVDVLENDTDANNDIDPTTVRIVTPDGNVTELTVDDEGQWRVNPDTGAITFEPVDGFTGDPTPIEYVVSDRTGKVSNPAKVGIDYIQHAPIANDDQKINQMVGSIVELDTLINDNDEDHDIDRSSVSITTPGAQDTDNDGDNDKLTVENEGEWTVDNSTGKITFAPKDDFTGDPTDIRYVISDNTGLVSNEATEKIDYTQNPELTFNKKATLNDGGDGLQAGDTITYEFNVTNTGNVPLSDVVIHDDRIDVDNLAVGDVGVGQSVIETAVYTIQQSDINEGNITNSATATAKDPEGNDVTDVSDDPITPEPNDPTVVDLSQPPVAQDDNKTGTVGEDVTVDVLENDTDANNDIDPTTVRIVTPDGNVTELTVDDEGQWRVNPDTGAITFEPVDGFTGDPTPIEYVVSDRTGKVSNPAKVGIDYPELPDYRPTVTITEGQIVDTPTATIKVLFRIVENNNGSNTGPVVLSIPIHDNLTTEYISDMTLLGDKAVNNADWEYDDSGDSYTLTYTANEGHFPPGTESYIGFIFEFEASENQKGKIPVKTTVQGNTAGDTLPNNDVDQDSLIYNNLK